MKVLFSSTMYPRHRGGWQGVFIGHIADALARHPEVDLAICAPPGEYPTNATSTTSESEARWLQELVDRGGISHLMRSRTPLALLAPVRLLWTLRRNYSALADVDVYHVNWMQTSLPLPDNGVPALITVLGNDLHLLRVPGMRNLLRRVMRSRTVILAPNAGWMQKPLAEAFGDIARIEPVSFGIAPGWYRLQRQWQSDWLVVSRLTRAKLGPLFDWAEDLFSHADRKLHLLGPMEEKIDVPEWVQYHGPVSPSELARTWFPKAAGLISLSRHAEGRPQVMLEAMASAIPIVASRIPAHSDLIRDGETGLLCDDSPSFAKAITMLEDPASNQRIGAAARDHMRAFVGTWDDCAQRYVGLYRSLMGSSP